MEQVSGSGAQASDEALNQVPAAGGTLDERELDQILRETSVARGAGQQEPVAGLSDSVTARPAIRPRPTPKVVVSPDRMTASLTLPDVEGSYTQSEVRAQLQQAGVVHGVKWSELSLLLAEGKPVQHVAVAVGTAPKPGADGRVEYLFRSTTEGLVEHAGRVDWREARVITSVEAGAPVARKIPAVPGEPGVDVLGHQVAARPPRDARVALGAGTALAEDDPNVVLATVSGAVRLDASGRVTVDNTYLIRGDVDLTTGNVDFDGSVVIDKDVRRGFSIKATGDVEVTGLIEEASIMAGGSIIALGGVIGGSGAASLQAGRDIMARFANQATLLAGHDVILGQEAINCTIEAEGRIAVGGAVPTRGFIRGGTLRAAQSISAFTVGAARGSRTELQAGYDWLLQRKLQSVDAELQTRQGQLERTRAQLHALQEQRARRELSTEERILLEKLRLADEALRVTVRSLETRRQMWQRMSSARATISVYGTAHSDIRLTVDGCVRVLSDDRHAETFVAEGDRVIGLAIKPTT